MDHTASLAGYLDFDGVVKRGSLQFLHLACHGSRVEVGVSLFRDDFQDLVHLVDIRTLPNLISGHEDTSKPRPDHFRTQTVLGHLCNCVLISSIIPQFQSPC